MAKREIKCPHCNKWTEWKESLDDRCLSCNSLIEQERINRLNDLAVQTKIEEELARIELAKKNPLLVKAGNYAKSIAIGFMIVLAAIIALAAG